MNKRVKKVTKQTDNRFLNLYLLDSETRDGQKITYELASRAKDINGLKLSGEEKASDKIANAVMICAVTGDKLVLEKQFRYPLDDYIYELPAGLIEKGEKTEDAGVREFYEETGMKLMLIKSFGSSRPFFSSAGMTDESISLVYGFASGTPTSEHEESTEDIEVILADRWECQRILKEENVSTMCALVMMNFIHNVRDPFGFLVD